MVKNTKRKTRAAILPLPGDPFLFTYWLKMFDEVWGKDVDKLYVYLNSSVEKEVVDYIRDLCNARPKINFQYNDKQIEHGDAINRALDIVEEELVMLIEDDGFIFKPGIVDHCFTILESGQAEIVGSKRRSCSNEIFDAAKKKFDLDYSGLGDQGPNFWPNFFFCSRQLLLSTDRHFGARAWSKFEKIEALDYEVEGLEGMVVAGDTFVNTSLQLRNMVPEKYIHYVNQYHAHPSDLDHALKNMWLFDGVAPWVHIGSLSSGIGGLLKDDENRVLARRSIDPPAGETILGNRPNTAMEEDEYERRVQIWHRAWSYCLPLIDSEDKIKEFHILYGIAIDRVVKDFGLSWKQINQRQLAYESRLGL